MTQKGEFRRSCVKVWQETHTLPLSPVPSFPQIPLTILLTATPAVVFIAAPAYKGQKGKRTPKRIK